jgi:hypothetical protein
MVRHGTHVDCTTDHINFDILSLFHMTGPQLSYQQVLTLNHIVTQYKPSSLRQFQSFVEIFLGDSLTLNLFRFFSKLNKFKIMLHILICTMHFIIYVKISNSTHHILNDSKVLTQSVHILTCFNGVLAYKVTFLIMMLALTETCYNVS